MSGYLGYKYTALPIQYPIPFSGTNSVDTVLDFPIGTIASTVPQCLNNLLPGTNTWNRANVTPSTSSTNRCVIDATIQWTPVLLNPYQPETAVRCTLFSVTAPPPRIVPPPPPYTSPITFVNVFSGINLNGVDNTDVFSAEGADDELAVVVYADEWLSVPAVNPASGSDPVFFGDVPRNLHWDVALNSLVTTYARANGTYDDMTAGPLYFMATAQFDTGPGTWSCRGRARVYFSN